MSLEKQTKAISNAVAQHIVQSLYLSVRQSFTLSFAEARGYFSCTVWTVSLPRTEVTAPCTLLELVDRSYESDKANT